MDAFEDLVSQLLVEDGYWIIQSFKVNLTKSEKKKINRPTTPRPEIDIIAYKADVNIIYAIEAKSFIDSIGVKIDEIDIEYEIQEGRYKLLTCSNYRKTVTKRLKHQLHEKGLINEKTKVSFGLVAGNVYQNKYEEIKTLYEKKRWLFWGPLEIKDKLENLIKKGYEDNAITMAAKLLLK